MTHDELDLIRKKLTSQDSILGKVMLTVGDIDLRMDKRLSYKGLVRTIISQQLSDKAANTIYARLENACGGSITPYTTAELSIDALRACGISNSKSAFIKDLSSRFLSEPNILEQIECSTDAGAYEILMGMNGIGFWSASVILLFLMKRIDIFPFGDATLNGAIYDLYGVDIPRRALKHPLVDKWKPYRSIAALYLWAWVDSGRPKIT